MSLYNSNFILNTDSYKASHWKQMPPGTTGQFSYIESRGGDHDATLFFGLQMFLKEYLSKPVTYDDITEASDFCAAHGVPFNYDGWSKLVSKHNGVLPIKIRAVKEGTIVPVSNVLVTLENTDPEFYWITSYLETSMLRAIWYPTTVATVSWDIKQIIKGYLDETGDPTGLPFKLHDFGARGVSSFESAGIGGCAHLANFMGSDTITGILYAKKYYNEQMAAFSIPAAEHSTITSWGREAEADAYKNMLTQFAKPGSILAVVSDSYDILKACDIWGTTLKQQIIDSGATVVIRPDSGDPATVVLDVVRRLDSHFGSVVNSKGYRVLNHVRVIQGDGVNEASIRGILMNLQFAGYSADNVTFGCGGYLLQIPHRDTQRFAQKCSAAKINGEWIDVYKDPITDSGKKSKRGRITLLQKEKEFMTVRESETINYPEWSEALETIWEDGKLLVEYTLSDIRELSNTFLK